MKRYIGIALALALVLSLAGCGEKPKDSGANPSSGPEAGGAPAYTIQLAHSMMENTPQHMGALKFKELVEEKTGGQVQVDIFPAGQLGSDVEVAEMLQTNAVQAGVVPTAKLSGFYAPLQVIDLPFLFPGKDVAYQVLDDQEFKDLLFVPMEELSFKGLSFWESGFKQFTANSPLKSPGDFKGLKFRVMESPLLIAQFQALGANPLSIDFSETYNSLQQGACDGPENPLSSIVQMKFYEVQSNMTISNHGYLAYALMLSLDFWNTLPAEYQTALQEAADEAAQYERAQTAEMEIGYIQTVRDSGTEIYELNAEEIAAFAEAMKPVHEQFRDIIGSDVLDETYALIEAAR